MIKVSYRDHSKNGHSNRRKTSKDSLKLLRIFGFFGAVIKCSKNFVVSLNISHEDFHWIVTACHF